MLIFVHRNSKVLNFLIFISCFNLVKIFSSTTYTTGVIYNVSLTMSNTSLSIMNGTCEECLCAMLLNTTPIVAFNCFRTNTTCELFSTALAFESGSFRLMNDSSSSFYFVPNLIYVMISATEQPTISTSNSSNKYSYFFKNVFHDVCEKSDQKSYLGSEQNKYSENNI
jgi:hypothetical protein